MILERTKIGFGPNRFEAQRSGFKSERRGSEMSELSAKPEARDMELASTRSS